MAQPRCTTREVRIMPRLRNPLLLLATLALLVPATASAQLFISEYIEGTSFNKAIEIYNPTGAAVDLSDYAIRLYSNGAAAPSQTTTLAGFLASGDVYVIANSQANLALTSVADLINDTVINFNGDDAFELYRISTASSIDVIGQIGVDPGVEWAGGGVSTLNRTIRRKADVCQGDPNGADAFDPSVEWDGFPVDTFNGFGAHTANCGPTPTNSSTWGRVKSLYR
jgi:predicted extracellular nuclease